MNTTNDPMHDLFAQLPPGDWIAAAIFGVGMAIIIMLLISRGVDSRGAGSIKRFAASSTSSKTKRSAANEDQTLRKNQICDRRGVRAHRAYALRVGAVGRRCNLLPPGLHAGKRPAIPRVLQDDLSRRGVSFGMALPGAIAKRIASEKEKR
jgi:hypothetical protein